MKEEIEIFIPYEMIGMVDLGIVVRVALFLIIFKYLSPLVLCQTL